ncbi:extracellular solute-binding protein [Dactylosporangium sp. NPDC051541]|uniref:extracellular solute-binding protein n=1 Tax=Dactylosporangium sp. NPDC051541 TaxID=3363977 RepID=UPI0037B687C4
MRTFRLLTLFTVGALTLSACGVGGDPGGGSSSGNTLTWASTGGQFQEDEKTALQVPFTAKTGTKFTNISPAEQAQVRTMVAAGKTIWDLANMSWIYAGAYCGELFEKLDDPRLERGKFPKGTTGDCFVPTYRYANIFSYNADLYPGEKPTKIQDFFDVKKFPGKRVVYDYPKAGLFEAALVADGVAPDKVYPLDLDRAFKKIDTIKSSLVFAPSYGAIQQMLVDKQAGMVLTVTARTIVSASSGANLVPVWDFNTTDIGVLVIPKGSPHKQLAQDMLAFVTEPAQAVAYAKLTGTAPARPDIDLNTVGYSDQQKQFNAFLPNRGTTIEQDKQWWIDNTDALTKRWTSWKVG